MAITGMQKIGLAFLKAEAKTVLKQLQSRGNFEVLAPVEKDALAFLPEDFSDLDLRIADLSFVLSYLTPFAPRATSLREKVLGVQIEAEEEEALLFAEKDFSSLIATCSAREEEEVHLSSQMEKQKETLRALEAWKGFAFPLSRIQETKETFFLLGSIEAKDVVDFSHEISEEKMIDLQVISRNPQQVFIFLIVHKSKREALNDLLIRFRFSESQLSSFMGTPAEEMAILQKKMDTAQNRLQEIRAEKKELAKDLRSVKLALEALSWRLDTRDILEKARATKSALFLEGWVPASEVDILRKTLEKITSFVEVTSLEKEKTETSPTQIKNGKNMNPFEVVLGLFGTPSSDELDPTPFLAPFFVVFFGFCLTDAGYGVLLVATLSFVLIKLPLTTEKKKMVKLLLFGGISTIIMGVLFGGYFGLTGAQLPFLYNEEAGRFYGQIFNPVTELTEKVMPLAYGLGVLQLFVAVVLSGVNRWRRGEKKLAIFGSGSLASIVVVAILWGLFPEVAFLFKPIFFFFLVTLIFGMMPKTGNIILRFLLGLLGVVNEAVSWLSNVLSYSRLFALGLATGVIALAFNSIATTIGGLLPPLVGIPVMIVIIFFGHTLNMGLNILGAFIHSARLQFVEFFGGFFQGGGRTFTPFKRRKKYIFVSK